MQVEIIATLISSGAALLMGGWGVYRQLKRDRKDVQLELQRIENEKAKETNKTDLDRMEFIKGSAVDLIEPMRAKIKELEAELIFLKSTLERVENELKEKEDKIIELERRIALLQSQVDALTCERDSLKVLLKDYLKT
jgi:chromosome segregation ATPase